MIFLVNENLYNETDTPILLALDDDHAFVTIYVSDYNAEGQVKPRQYMARSSANTAGNK